MSSVAQFSLIQNIILQYYYHLQTKFAKVMFSQVSVCPRGVSAPLYAGIHTPRIRGRHPAWADTPLRSACWDMVNKRAVCILLQCFLVFRHICIVYFFMLPKKFSHRPLLYDLFNKAELIKGNSSWQYNDLT